MMKLGTLVSLIPMASAFPDFSPAQIWLASFQQPLRNFMESPLRRSTVPQFILDTRHPWILANQRKLEGLPDAEEFLCSGPYESTEVETQTSGNELKIPLNLFDNLEINNNRAGMSRPGWPNALERLGEMKRCQRALRQVKTLDVYIYVHRGKYSDLSLKILEPFRPPEQLLILFGDVLESMTSLETLKWGIGKEDTHFFEEAFKSRNLTLPSIKHLEPGPSSDYLVGICPNLETLKNGGGFMWYHGYMPDNRDWGLMLVQAAVSTPKLKYFSMIGGHNGWTESLVSEVVKSMPQLTRFGMLGSLGKDRGYTGIDTGDSGELKHILELLTGLKNLTHLDLPASSRLGVGFNGGPGCGNVYFGKQGRVYRRQVTQEGAEATEKGGDIVVAILPHLTRLTIGGTEANITRTEEGVINVTWPWTGRMVEWLMEVVPERPDFEDVKYNAM